MDEVVDDADTLTFAWDRAATRAALLIGVPLGGAVLGSGCLNRDDRVLE